MHRCQAKNPEQFRNERDAIPEVRNTDGQLLAPNGRPSKIQNLELWRTIRHPNFKKWFGDWELAATGIDTIVGKDGKVNYDTAKKIASGIISGSVQTANEQRQQAQVRGGSRNVEASVILTGKERTKPTASRGSERFEGIARQEEALERYAKHEKIWLDEKADNRKFVNSGKESRVYDNGDTVRKFTDPRSINRGVTPLDHLNNITSFDAVFPETAYTVEGFARDASGKLKFVTTQPFIVGRLSTPAEIERAMKDRGFTKIDSETFENADYVVHDLAPRNVIFDPESSQAFVIDANVTQKKAENETYSVNDVSKVVDENGEPLVVYHGTPDSRGIYKHGFRTRKEAIFNDQQDEPQKSFFFSDDVRVADTYADPLRSSDYQNAEPETLPLFINIREATMLNLRGARWRQVDDAIVSAKKAGHDGLVIRNVVDPYNLPEATPRTRRSMTTYVAFAPNQIKSIFNRGTFDADEDSILKMVAWHGSPHRFDKFSTEKIGTGEGNQAYGHGLYFSDKEAIADYYKENLTRSLDIPPNPFGFYQGGSFYTRRNGLYYEITSLGENKEVTKDRYTTAFVHAQAEFAATPKSGAKYRVDLKPAEDEYLLWDKPLSQQSEKVKNAFRRVRDELLDTFYHNAKSGITYDLARKGEQSVVHGGLWYQRLQNTNIGGNSIGSAKKVSDALASSGIRGIKYLDGSSRGGGKSVWRKGADESKYHYLTQGVADNYLESRNGDLAAAIVSLKEVADKSQQYADAARALENGDLSYEQNEQTYNYVIFDDADVEIEEVLHSISYAKEQRRLWIDRVNDFFRGNEWQNAVRIFDRTPLMLKEIGVPANSLYITPSVIEKLRGDHGLSAANVAELFDDLINPIMVFDSASQAGSKVVVTAQKDYKGEPIIVSIKPNGEVTVKTTATGKAVGETANILTSAYGKPNAGLQRWIDDGLLRYRNTDKGKTWWHGQNRLQLPTRDSRDTTSKNKVLTQDDFVNTPLFKRRTAEDSAEQKELTFYSTNDLVDRLDPSQIQLDENGELRMDAKAAEVWRRLDIHYTEEVLGKAGNDNVFMGLALSAKQITDRTNFYREQIEPQFIEAGHTDESLTGIRALMTGLDDLAKVSKKQAVNKSANWGLALV